MDDVTGIEGKGVVDSNFSYNFNPFNQGFTTPTYTSTTQTKSSDSTVDFGTMTNDVKTEQTTKTTKKKKYPWEYISDGLDWLGGKIEDAAATVCEVTTSALSAVGSVVEVVVDTGANLAADVVGIFDKDAAQKIENWANKDMTSKWVDDLHNNTAYGQWMAEHSWVSPDSAFANGMKNAGKILENVGATIAVATNAVVGGLLNIVETVGDGILYCSGWLAYGMAMLAGDEQLAKDSLQTAREWIAEDWSDDLEKWYYNNTASGRRLNEHSYLKYDSDIAKGIKNVSEKVGVVVAATALTIFTGGAGAALVGGLYGLGQASESTYQSIMESEGYNGYINTTPWQEIMILGSGALNALSWQSTGALGASFLNIAKTAGELGGYEAAKTLFKFAFSKENLRDVFSKKNTIMNGISSLLQSGGDIAQIFTKLVNGKEVTGEELGWFAAKVVGRFGLNVFDDLMKGGIKSYDKALKAGDDIQDALRLANLTNDEKAKLASGELTAAQILGKADDAEKLDAPEVLDMKAPDGDDVKTVTPDTDSPDIKGDMDDVKTPGGGEKPPVRSDGVNFKTVEPDDLAISRAEDILNPNTVTKLGDFTSESDDDLRRILTVMTGDEIAAQLKTVKDPADVERILNMLDGQTTNELVGTLGELYTKNGFDVDTFKKLDPVIQLEVLERTDPQQVAKCISDGSFAIDDVYKLMGDSEYFNTVDVQALVLQNQSQIADLEKQLATLDKGTEDWKDLDNKIKDLKARTHELDNIDAVVNRQMDFIEDFCKKNGLSGTDVPTREQVWEILRTPKGERSKLSLPKAYVDAIRDANYKASGDMDFGSFVVKDGESVAFKFVKSEAARKGEVGGFACGIDMVDKIKAQAQKINPSGDLTDSQLQELYRYIESDIIAAKAGYLGEAKMVVFSGDDLQLNYITGDEFNAWPDWWAPGCFTASDCVEMHAQFASSFWQNPKNAKESYKLIKSAYKTISVADFIKSILKG